MCRSEPVPEFSRRPKSGTGSSLHCSQRNIIHLETRPAVPTRPGRRDGHRFPYPSHRPQLEERRAGRGRPDDETELRDTESRRISIPMRHPTIFFAKCAGGSAVPLLILALNSCGGASESVAAPEVNVEAATLIEASTPAPMRHLVFGRSHD
jgi:hypothetical protein